MGFLVYIGAALAAIGIGGVIYCARIAVQIKKETDEEVAKKRLQSLIAWNFGSLAIAAFGLIMMVIGMAL